MLAFRAALAARGELGRRLLRCSIKSPIRAMSSIKQSPEAGMVVKRGDRYQDVVAVDRNGSTVTVRDEEGRLLWFHRRS
jgi:hypothetical protein